MNQENGSIKQFKLRMPMQLFYQLKIDADKHSETPSERARHIMLDALMDIDVSTPEHQAEIKKLIEENWKKINGKGEPKDD